MAKAQKKEAFDGLVVENLSKSFGGVHAVNGVSFTIAAGKFVALIGPNGAGKTTCFNMVNGQLIPNSGSIRFGEHDLTGKTPAQIWKLGVGRTFQITATYPTMTVIENVQMALISHHKRLFSLIARASSNYRAKALELLEMVNMADQAERSCGIIAYGDLKRVEIAVALANAPRLLLMDEPTAGMAPGERADLMALTSTIARERNIAVLFTEHDMDTVFTHADEVLVLNLGQLIARGTPLQVRNNTQVQEIYLGTGATYAKDTKSKSKPRPKSRAKSAPKSRPKPKGKRS